MKIKILVPETHFQAGTGGFKIPRGYRFVRKCVNRFASEYYLIPFHWPAKLFWVVSDYFVHKAGLLFLKMYAKGWFTIDDEPRMLTWGQLFKYVWRNRTYAKKKEKKTN